MTNTSVVHANTMAQQTPCPTTSSAACPDGRHPKQISIREGILRLEPNKKPCEGLLQVFLLSKVIWFVLGELDNQEKSKLLEREVDFARVRLGYTFRNDDANTEADNCDVVEAILNWAEIEVKKEIPPTAFRRLQQAVAEMKTSRKPQVVQGRSHRLHQETENDPNKREATRMLADDPQPLGVSSATWFDPIGQDLRHGVGVQPDDLNRLFDSEEEQLSLESRRTRNTSKRKRYGQGQAKTLEALRKELDETHPQPSKKRRVQKYDVVSGKGEKAKQQNKHYLEMIRTNAPIFRSMDTGNSDQDLEEKRKMAYRIALEIVGSGGCFVGKDEKPMSPKQAFKRVMTSLKDWRKPRKSNQNQNQKTKEVLPVHTNAISKPPTSVADSTRTVRDETKTEDIDAKEEEDIAGDFTPIDLGLGDYDGLDGLGRMFDTSLPIDDDILALFDPKETKLNLESLSS